MPPRPPPMHQCSYGPCRHNLQTQSASWCVKAPPSWAPPIRDHVDTGYMCTCHVTCTCNCTSVSRPIFHVALHNSLSTSQPTRLLPYQAS